MAHMAMRYYGGPVGVDGYPAEWHLTVKHLVRELAGHRCERCRHPYRVGEHGSGEWTPCDLECRHGGPLRENMPDTPVESQWRILTVHHLDGDKRNCRWWNLAALCQRCHLTIQGKVRLDREFILEHTDWFKPHAAGWYAWKYEGLEITRQEAEERMEELLGYEFRQPSLESA